MVVQSVHMFFWFHTLSRRTDLSARVLQRFGSYIQRLFIAVVYAGGFVEQPGSSLGPGIGTEV